MEKFEVSKLMLGAVLQSALDHQINGEGGTVAVEHVQCNYTNIISKHIAICCATLFQANVSHLKGVLYSLFVHLILVYYSFNL